MKKKLLAVILAFIMVVGIYAMGVNFYVISKSSSRIISAEQARNEADIDAVLVLGCGIKPDNTPSDMLNERLKTGSSLMEGLNGSYLLLSGDNSGEDYNELKVMKRVSIENGVDESNIKTDDFGFSTYESIYNAKNTFGIKKMLIVTQPYHMSRALYIAEKLGIEAYGVTAYLPLYPKQIIWSTREVLARNKDFLKCCINGANNEKAD